MGNTIGKIFQLTTFGESHGPAIGGVIDGCPAGLKLDYAFIQSELDRRKPGQSKITTQRKETDTFEILSGVIPPSGGVGAVTLGSPLAFIIRNQDYRPSDYDEMENVFRPSHADYTYHAKYGIRDHRGGGRSSARATAACVFGGAVAKLLLQAPPPPEGGSMVINAYVSRVADVVLNKDYTQLNLDNTENNIVRCPDEATASKMIEVIEQARKDGDTVGGVITCVIKNIPAGLGEPVFDKLQASLAHAIMSINAAHGFEYGSGFAGTRMRGSEHNDIFISRESGVGSREKKTGPAADSQLPTPNSLLTKTNNSGGIQGGISNGMDIYFNVAFKPVSTLMKSQQTVDMAGNAAVIKGKGRHDPCVLPRAVPIVEAMAALVMADHWMRDKNSRV